MPRIRTIKPEAFASESLAKVSLTAERTFWGLTTQADDRGRCRDNAAVIAGALWSLRPEHTAVDVERDLQELAAADELICRYTGCDGKQYLHFPSWDRHQRINRPSISRAAACRIHEIKAVCGVCKNTECKSHRNIPEDSRDTHETLTETSVQPHGGFEETPGQDASTEDSLSPHDGLDEDSRTDLVPRTVDLGPSAPTERRADARAAEPDDHEPDHGPADDPGDEPPPTTAHDLLADWLAHIPKRPPERVIGQVGAAIKQMLDEDIAPADIRLGVVAWARKGCAPSALPSFVNEAMNAEPTPPAKPTPQPDSYAESIAAIEARAAADDATEDTDAPRLRVVPRRADPPTDLLADVRAQMRQRRDTA